MPPAAALECERTGWTLLTIATEAPASAAARAARWPARPAPMMRTSWLGMGGAESYWTPDGRRQRAKARVDALGTRRLWRLRRHRRLKRAPDLLDRDDPAQDAARIDGHQRAVAAQRF